MADQVKFVAEGGLFVPNSAANSTLNTTTFDKDITVLGDLTTNGNITLGNTTSNLVVTGTFTNIATSNTSFTNAVTFGANTTFEKSVVIKNDLDANGNITLGNTTSNLVVTGTFTNIATSNTSFTNVVTFGANTTFEKSVVIKNDLDANGDVLLGNSTSNLVVTGTFTNIATSNTSFTNVVTFGANTTFEKSVVIKNDLDANGDVLLGNATSNLVVTGTFTNIATSNTSFLNVVTFNANVTHETNLRVKGNIVANGDVTVGNTTSNLVVTGTFTNIATNNTSFMNVVTFNQSVTLANNLTVNGNILGVGNVNVGNSTLNVVVRGELANIAANNTVIGGSFLNVSSTNTSFTSAVTLGGVVTIANNVTIRGNTTANGNIVANGDVTLGNTVSNLVVTGTFTNIATSNTSFTNVVTFGAAVTFANNITVRGNITANGNITAGNDTSTFTLIGSLANIATSNTSFANVVTFKENVTMDKNLTANGNITLANSTSTILVRGSFANIATDSTIFMNVVQFKQAVTFDVSPIFVSGQVVGGSVIPFNNTYSLGNTSNIWDYLYANNVQIVGGNFKISNTAANISANSTALAIANSTTNTTIVSGSITIGTATVNSTVYSATANNADNLGGTAAASYALKTYADAAAGNAYTNAAAFAANATNISSGTVGIPYLPVANTTSNGIVRVVDSVSNSSINGFAAAPNSVKTAYDAAITANGVANSRVSSVTASSPLSSNGGLTPNISHNTSGALAGQYGSSNATSLTVPIVDVDIYGHVTNAASVAVRAGNSTVAGVLQIVDSISNTSITIAATASSVKTAYDAAIAANGVANSRVSSVGASSPLSSNGGLTPSISHNTSGVGGGTYGSSNSTSLSVPVITVDAYGHVNTAVNTAIRAGNTSVTGVLQLIDSISSTNTTTAATPNSVKTAYDVAVTANGVANSRVSSVTASSPLASNGGLTPNISHNTSGVASGTYGSSNSTSLSVPVITIDTFGHITSASNTAVRAGNTTIAGVLQLTDSIASTNTTTAATPNSVKTAYDLASTAKSTADGKVASVTASTVLSSSGGTTPNITHNTSGVVAITYGSSTSVPVVTVDTYGHITSATTNAIPTGSTITAGLLQLTDSVISTSTTTAATPNSVKTAYDLAASKISSITINNGTGISGGGTGTSFTLSIGQAVGTTSSVQFGSLGVGTAASGTTGEIRATDNITAYYSSDYRLKENIKNIGNALYKVENINGVEFDWKEDYIKKAGGEDGYFVRKHDIGVIAQEIQSVLPEAVGEREDGILAVKYERIVPLLIEAIKELNNKVKDLERRLQ